MGCITKLLESGQKFVNGHYHAAIEGGGLYNGYEYLMTLTNRGRRCGYVAISKKHPLYKEKHCHAKKILKLEMHGGCTFYEEQMTESDCSDKWIGFDCSHFADRPDFEAAKLAFIDFPEHLEGLEYLQELASSYPLAHPESSIKTKEFAEGQCKLIIDQLNAKYA